MLEIYLSVFFSIFFIGVFGTLLIIFAVRHTNLSNVRKRQEEINSKANKSIQNIEFKQTKIFFLNDYATYNQSDSCKKYISIDNENKKICLIDYTKDSLIIVGFDEILNYEIYDNGSTFTNGGGLNVGFGIGIFDAETQGICKELKLIIRLKRYEIPQISYSIISNTPFNSGINKSTEAYRKCISSLQEVVSFLEV